MKRQFVLSCVLLLIAIPAHGAPAYVQSGYDEAVPVTTLNVDFSIPGPAADVTAGNLIVVTVRTDNTHGPVASVTSQPGNQTGILAKRQQSGTSFWLEVWYIQNATGGATTVTVTVSGTADAIRVVLDEYSGVALSSPVDGTPVSGTATSATANAGDITTTVANALIHIAAACDGNDDFGTNATPPTGYSDHYLGPDPGAGSDKTATASGVEATAGTYPTTMANANDTWAAVAVAFAPAGDGGGSGSRPSVSSRPGVSARPVAPSRPAAGSRPAL